MELTVNEAFAVNSQLEKKRMPGGQTIKPDILNAKGDAGMALYFLKHSVKDAFKAHFERVDDLLKEKQKLQQKDDPTDGDKERLEEINDELDEISQKTEEVDVKKQIPFQGIKNYADVDALEALDFAIDFGEE